MRIALMIAVGAVVLLHACSSPLDLDVDRTKNYPDGGTHPTRLSLYYYFGDSAYEAIVTDTLLLNNIWIEIGSQFLPLSFIFLTRSRRVRNSRRLCERLHSQAPMYCAMDSSRRAPHH